MGNFTAAKRAWRTVFVLYAVLSLSSMAGMSIGLGLFGAAALWFFYAGWKQGAMPLLREVFATPFSSATGLLFVVSLLSILAAMAFPVAGSVEGPSLAALKKYHYFIFPPLFAAAFLATSDSVERHPFWKVWGIFGGFLGALAVVQFFGADLFPEAWLHGTFFRQVGGTNRFHGQGLMFFHLSFASCMCFVAAAAWARVLFPLWGDDRATRLLWAGIAALGTCGVWFSYSRIAFVALALVVLVLGALRKPLYGWAALFFVAVGGYGLWLLSPSLQQRFALGDGGTFERQGMWKSAWAMFEARPALGVGFGRTGELSPYFLRHVLGIQGAFTSHAHNNILDILAATGALGLLAFTAWWGFLFWAAAWCFQRAPLERRWLPAAALAGLLAFQVNGLTQVNFWDGKSEHTLMLWAGVVLALWLAEKRRIAAN